MLSHPSSWFGHMMPADFCSSRGGIANVLNPIDHPWNFDSSTVAKRRVRNVVWADRSRCGDGKWVARPSAEFVGIDQWGRYLFKTADKPRYRWEARR